MDYSFSLCPRVQLVLSDDLPYGFWDLLDIPHKLISCNKFLTVLLVWLNGTDVDEKHLFAVITNIHEKIVGPD
jgi:hypothetical protein